jgi:octaprenyl-diphosphate synthase
MSISLEVTRYIKIFDSKLDEIIHEDLPILKDIKKHVIKSGGKRIRPLTHVFLSQLLGYKGKLWQDVGAIAELIHSASLLHDDVVDGAELRRGEPTIGKLHGNKTAILAGDYLLASGIEHLNRLGSPELMSAFTSVIRDLSVGELIQMEWEKNPKITIKIYDKIIYGKTSSLFGAVSQTAGIIAGVSNPKIKDLHTFGVTMGNLFQKKDDYIDYFESQDKSGKARFKDFSNGLFTHPIILLMENSNKSQQKHTDGSQDTRKEAVQTLAGV